VTDEAGQSATDAVVFLQDATAPILSDISIVPLVRRTDKVSIVSVVATDDRSGVEAGDVSYDGFQGSGSVPMTLDGPALRGTLGSDLRSGMYQVSANVSDRAGNGSSLQIPLGSFIVFDTMSRSTGHGKFVPTSGTAKLPRIDGRSALRFGFDIRYARPKASHPVGWLWFDYARGRVHMKATSFDWLAHFDDRTYVVLGTATVVGQPGTFRFRTIITDGVGTDLDSLSVTVWPQGAVEPSSPFDATYAAWSSLSGDTLANVG
jgi:hypothetical protein